MNGAFLLDVVVAKSSGVLETFSGEDESLLVLGDSFLVSDFSLEIGDCVSVGGFESDSLSSESFAEDLETSSESEEKVDGVHFLNVVVRENSVVLEFFSPEHKSNLISGETLMSVKLFLKFSYSVCAFNVAGEGLSGNCFAEYLHWSCHLFVCLVSDYCQTLRLK